METQADEAPQTTKDAFFTVAEVADMLKLSAHTIRRYLTRGKLKGVNLGKAWRIPLQEVQRLQQHLGPEA